jgi:hypothetical protein
MQDPRVIEEARMNGPLDPFKEQVLWDELKKQDYLFPESGDRSESADLITELNSKIEQLEDLCGLLSYTLRDVSQVLKIKSSI